MLILVKCINVYEDTPKQITVGQKYWVDDETDYKGIDGNVYVNVYKDKSKKQFIGVIDMSHFEVMYRHLKYGLSLTAYINTQQTCLLKDIVKWCLDNSTVQLAYCIFAYINDNGLNTEENQYKEYYVKSCSVEEFIRQNKRDEYTKYLGYSLECAE